MTLCEGVFVFLPVFHCSTMLLELCACDLANLNAGTTHLGSECYCRPIKSSSSNSLRSGCNLLAGVVVFVAVVVAGEVPTSSSLHGQIFEYI